MATPPVKRLETRTIEDFEVKDVLGEGSYAVVHLAEEKSNGLLCAVKQVSKNHIIKQKKVESIKREKYLLSRLKGKRGIATLLYTFQDTTSLYFVLEYLPNGDLLSKLQEHKKLSLGCVRFYAAQIVAMLETLRSANVAHRDLKPENLMLTKDNHLRLIDFGSAIQFKSPRGRSKSFVGTLEYLPPELLSKDKSCGVYGDLWALGCIVYQMLFGTVPFRGDSEWLTFNLIKKRDVLFPIDYPHRQAISFINSLLVSRPELRLGAGDGGLSEVRQHEFFAGIVWDTLFEETPPEFVTSEVEIVFPEREEQDIELPKEVEKPEVDQSTTNTLSMELGSSYRIQEPGSTEASDKLTADELKSKRRDTISMQKSIIWSKWLIPDAELIVEMGLVVKKKGLFPRRRMLILTDLPRIFYIDPERMMQKGEIPWSDAIVTEVKSKTHFNIITPKRTYFLEDCQSNPFRWGESIELVKSLVGARDLMSSGGS